MWTVIGCSPGCSSLRVVTLCSVLVFAGRLAEAEARRPLAQIDLAAVSAPFNRALQQAKGFPANVQLSFLGEDQLAVSSMDDWYYPLYGHVATKKFHFTLDIISLIGGSLKPSNQLRFETETSDSSFAALPSGKLIVNTRKELTVLDESLHVALRGTVEQACDAPPGMDLDEPFWTRLLAGSEEIGFVSVERAGRINLTEGPPIPLDTWNCWFSTTTLQLVARTNMKLVLPGPASTARGLLVDSHSWSFSPTGQHIMAFPASSSCVAPALERIAPEVNLLRAEAASVFRCKKGAILIERGEEKSVIRLKGEDDWYFRTDAWKVPLAIFVGGSFHVPLFGGNFSGRTATRLVNYRTGVSIELPDIKINVHSDVYAGPTLQYAISPGGHHVAVLSGPVLAIFDVPQSLLN